jgi:Mitochondrial K+-H+ exchange-related
VKIYLLAIDKRRCFFYADESEASAEEGEGSGSSGPPPAGLKGRLIDRYHKIKSAWDHSESRVARWSHRAWDWLHSWSHPDESMLVRLRSARRIDLHHPASRPGDEVRALWGSYLNHRWWRHLLWMSLNAAIAPFAGLLAILPGPNVIGYWFAYRAIHHTLIVWGIRRVRKARIPIEFHPRASLDRPIEVDEAGTAKHEAIAGEATLLDEHVAWTESESPNPPEADRP